MSRRPLYWLARVGMAISRKLPSSVSTTATGAESQLGEREVPLRGMTILDSPDPERSDSRLVISDELRIGRVSRADVNFVIKDPKISARHASIRVLADEGCFQVRDLGSSNGTFVEGRQVTTRRVPDASILRIGDTLLEVGLQHLMDQLPDDRLVGVSTEFVGVLTAIDRVASSDIPVLLLGETGVGKSLVAQRIHQRSGRPGGFVAINCGAIPSELVESQLFGHRKGAFTGAVEDARGLFHQAQRGTLFLDEIGALPLKQQPKLLRVLESQEFTPVGDTAILKTDARIIAATNSDLQAEADRGSFRQDLFTRLAGYIIMVPPLRHRRSDIPRLARHFLTELNWPEGILWTANFLENLLLYTWPGNVRELKYLMERLTLLEGGVETFASRHLASLLPNVSINTGTFKAVVVSPRATHATLPHAAVLPGRGRKHRRPNRDDLIAKLVTFEGNVTQVAAAYGKDPKQIYRWMKASGIDPDDFRAA